MRKLMNSDLLYAKKIIYDSMSLLSEPPDTRILEEFLSQTIQFSSDHLKPLLMDIFFEGIKQVVI
jgi:hypothetical protein